MALLPTSCRYSILQVLDCWSVQAQFLIIILVHPFWSPQSRVSQTNDEKFWEGEIQSMIWHSSIQRNILSWITQRRCIGCHLYSIHVCGLRKGCCHKCQDKAGRSYWGRVKLGRRRRGDTKVEPKLVGK